MKHLILATSALTLISCGGHEGHNKDDMASHEMGNHHAMEAGIEVSSAYVQPPFPGRDVAAGFFKLTNMGDDDKLLSVSSPISETVEIHNHIEDNGVMKMRKVDLVNLPKGETVEFKPGSFHIMMFGADIPENATDVSLTLTYETSDPVTLIVPIGEADESDSGGHSGH